MLHITATNVTEGVFFFAERRTLTSSADSKSLTHASLFMIYAGIIGAIGRKIRSSAMRLTHGETRRVGPSHFSSSPLSKYTFTRFK